MTISQNVKNAKQNIMNFQTVENGDADSLTREEC